MRITPTREQLVYLSSIGVVDDTLFPPVHPSAVAEAGDRVTIDRYSTHSLGLVWWFIIFLVIVFVLIAYSGGMVRGEDNSQSPLVSEMINKDASVVTQARIAALERRVDMLTNLVEHIRKDLAPRVELVDLQQRLLLFRKDIDKAISTTTEVNQATVAELVDLQQRFLVFRKDIDRAMITATQVNQSTVALRKQLGAEENEVRMLLREKIDAQANRATQMLVLLMIAGCLLTTLVVIWMMIMKKRLNQLEMETITQATLIPVDGVKTDSGNKGEKPAVKPASPCDSGVKPKRPIIKSLPNSPRQTMELIIQSTACIKHFRVKPRHPEGPWTMGLSTAKGNVRLENQDYGLAFQMDNGHHVLIVADGLGGVPLGQRAAHLVSVTAAASVLRTYSTASLLCTPQARDVAVKAIKDAAHCLAVEGDKRNISDSRSGLRTTLIVLVGNKREVGYAYIGDGGGCIVRTSGEIEQFLVPQKADGFAMNVLAASLGPITEGELVAGTIKRAPGDLIIIGSDGVFDRVGQEFPKDVLRGCIQFKGDLQATADHIIEELATFKDSAGFVCEDNLTLALMGDGTSPCLAQGFWSTNSPRNVPAGSPEQAVETVKEATK